MACGNSNRARRSTPDAPDDELESPTRQLTGWPARIATVLAIGLVAVLALLGPRHRPAARLSRQLPADRRSCSASCSTRDRTASARAAYSPLDWLFVALVGRLAAVAAGRLRQLHLPRGGSDDARHDARRHLHPARARGDAPHRRLGAADHRRPASSSTPSTGRCSISSASA